MVRHSKENAAGEEKECLGQTRQKYILGACLGMLEPLGKSPSFFEPLYVPLENSDDDPFLSGWLSCCRRCD